MKNNRFLELVEMASHAPRDENHNIMVEIIGVKYLPMFYIFLN
jgi:hypothetical protein